MKIKAKIKFRYKNEKYSKIAFKSLQPDNIGFVDSYISEKYLICKLDGDSIGRLLATADDLLFCEMMIERVAEL
jgi:hypothetical protein